MDINNFDSNKQLNIFINRVDPVSLKQEKKCIFLSGIYISEYIEKQNNNALAIFIGKRNWRE